MNWEILNGMGSEIGVFNTLMIFLMILGVIYKFFYKPWLDERRLKLGKPNPNKTSSKTNPSATTISLIGQELRLFKEGQEKFNDEIKAKVERLDGKIDKLEIKTGG